MIEFDEKYKVGIQSIDNQHKEIFRLLNELLESMKNGQANSTILPIIQELERYSLLHFQKEEFFFHQFKYSETEAHIAEHKLFIQKLARIKTELKTGKILASIELLAFLKDWIQNHILVVDQAYSECFIQNGLK